MGASAMVMMVRRMTDVMVRVMLDECSDAVWLHVFMRVMIKRTGFAAVVVMTAMTVISTTMTLDAQVVTLVTTLLTTRQACKHVYYQVLPTHDFFCSCS